MKDRKLCKDMKKRGWSREITGKGHLKFIFNKTKEFVIHPSTASDFRAVKNLMSRVKRIENGTEAAHRKARQTSREDN